MKNIDNQVEIAIMNIGMDVVSKGNALTESSLLDELNRTGICKNWEDYMITTVGHKGDFKSTALFSIKHLRDQGVFGWLVGKQRDDAVDNLYSINVLLLMKYYIELINELFKVVAPCDDGSGDYVYSCVTDDGTYLDEHFYPILTPEHMLKVKEVADHFNVDYAFTY